jgi:AcrR family transcriptional regulator
VFNLFVNVYTGTMNSSPTTPVRSVEKKKKATGEARQLRHQALAGVRRELILDAARSVFFELGMEKTSIREIALRAGYTPGAIYSYFASKEELYGALLAGSLDRLNAGVEDAIKDRDVGSDSLRAAARAFFDFYRENPRDLDLGFYLFQGMKPRGLTPELNETLNARLRNALQAAQDALQHLGLPPEKAVAEVTALFAHTVGLLVLSHTGRIRMFKQASQDLFDTYLDQLVSRAQLHA